MDWLKIISFTVSLLSVAAAILAFAYKYGKSQESILQKLTSMEQRFNDTSSDIKHHIADSSLHVNEKLQQRIDADRTAFQVETKAKLDEITRQIYAQGGHGKDGR